MSAVHGGAGQFPGNTDGLEKLRAKEEPSDLPVVQDMDIEANWGVHASQGDRQKSGCIKLCWSDKAAVESVKSE